VDVEYDDEDVPELEGIQHINLDIQIDDVQDLNDQ
jgi:hypothetical protein